MFARTVALPARSGASDVCLACRHEHALSTRQSQLQRRWNSESTGSKASHGTGDADAADEWLLPLNSFSDEFGDKMTSKHSPQALRKSPSFVRRVPTSRNAPFHDAASDQPTGLKKRRPQGQIWRRTVPKPPPGSDSRVALAVLLANFGGPNDRKEHATVAQKGGPRPTTSEPSDKHTIRRDEMISGTPEKEKLWDQVGLGLQEELDALAAETSAGDGEAEYNEYLEKSAVTSGSVPDPELKSTEPVPFPSFSSKESPTMPASSPSLFSSALNYFRQKIGLSKPSHVNETKTDRENRAKIVEPDRESQAKNVEPDRQIQAKNVEPDDTKPAGKARDVNSPTTARVPGVESALYNIRLPRNHTPDRHQSPVERWQESRTRQPWGPATPKVLDERVASFDEIASADRMSIKKTIATSVSSKPFGIKPALNMADLKGKLAQFLAEDDHVSPSRDEAAAHPLYSDTAHSRSSGLSSTRNDVDETAAKPLDTLDLAFSRSRHDQNLAQQDVETSITKGFPGLPLTDPKLIHATKEETKRVLNESASGTYTPLVQYSSQPASSYTSIGGMSIGAAMRATMTPPDAPAPPIRKRGRPRKGSATDSKPSRTAANNKVSDETGQIMPQLSDEAPSIEPAEESSPTPATSVDGFRTTTPSQLHITPLDIPQPRVPYLQYGLDRVLFNPGVYQLQDQVSRVYNFDPYLQNIMPNVEFDFDSLKEYKTSSKDEALAKIAKEHGNKYIGSTSSMTSALGHFHFLLSNWRPLNFGMLSNDFVAESSKALPKQLTQINRAPAAFFLRWKNGTYAIDADKEHDHANVLMLLGKSMELLLTLPKSEFERYRKSDPRKVTEDQRTAPESYQYTTMRDFLMRSQLDAYDPRLPGNGAFDLKTRAVVSVRMAADDHEPMTGYELYTQQGRWCSYEKEYYDMMRSTMLKYMLQARMGRMNGIFVAYHNVERMFGFQYLPIADMDRGLHGQTDPSLGDQEFRASLDMLNEVLNAATAKFPEQSLRVHFETKEAEPGDNGMPTALHVFAEPMSEEECDKIQDSQKAKIAEWERTVMGKNVAEAEDAQVTNLSADEVLNPDFSNEVVQDDATSGLEDETTVVDEEENATIASWEHDAQAYPPSLLPSNEEVAAQDASTAPFDNSCSNADPQFLNTLAASDPDELKPLFYATIITQSSINGDVRERPQNLTSEDEWTIDYILKEYNITPHQWAVYEDLKARRRVVYANNEEEEGVVKEESSFLNFLRSMSEKGRAIRKAKDVAEDGLPVVRVEELDMERLDKVESVDDYMRFLEKPREAGTREMFG